LKRRDNSLDEAILGSISNAIPKARRLQPSILAQDGNQPLFPGLASVTTTRQDLFFLDGGYLYALDFADNFADASGSLAIPLDPPLQHIIDILKNARQPMFLVSVSDQARRLSGIERKPARMEPGSAGRRVVARA
jgi:hypothetical protein